ncbi:winged helix DNA-binding protein [Bacillus lacus]|uniref:Winged helix DNA-binding protein n=1 Tax=Metabacillus lacus TaxID=1983721 RepID=A0A7X2J323_9BACI|nr:winged helix DNA-binding protein [Metabacillus lacus]
MDHNKLFKQFVRFTASVHQTSNEITKEIQVENITNTQYKILEFITVNQPVTLTRISDCLNISLPNSSRELKKLIENQLCEKVSDLKDRRIFHIRLTDKGTAIMEEAFQQIQQVFQERMNDLTESELNEVGRAFRTLQEKVFLQTKA